MSQPFSTAAMQLKDLNDELPVERFTLDWLLKRLGAQSSGLLILVFALLAAAPGVSVPAGVLVLLTAAQMAAGSPRPTFPKWIAERPLPSRSLSAILRRAIPVLTFIERVVRRRGPAATRARQRAVGGVVLMLAIRLLTNPLPFSNVVPALVIALIALAHIEEDGLLLSVALAIALLTLWADIAVLWKVVHQLPLPA
ncbi:MAG: exopolysaccharide biosynthesis protein [Alphaproteobacteria bacterium]|nr:MAG: exopolysaccharide biosynthesis protein [Alphaproteobacteria bacterium]